MLVLLGGLTTGMREAMLQSATTLMTGHVNLAGFFKITSGTAAPIVAGWEKPWDAVKGQVPELDYAAPRGRGWAKAVADGGSMDLILAGVELDREPGFRDVDPGGRRHRSTSCAKPGTILLFQDQAKRLGVKPGDTLTLSAPTTRGASNTADVRVGRGGPQHRAPLGLQRLHPGRDAAPALPAQGRDHRRHPAST